MMSSQVGRDDMVYFHPLGGGYCIGLLVPWICIYFGGSGDEV